MGKENGSYNEKSSGNFLVQLFYGRTQEWTKSAKANKIDILPSIRLINHIFFKTSFRGITFHLLFVTRWNSLVARCKICSLLVAEVTPCKRSLVTRCRSCSLQKNTRCSLQNSLVTCSRSCSLQKINRYSLQNSLFTCYKK